MALDRGERVALLTYRLDGDTFEIVTLDSLREGVGVGRALIEGVAAEAQGLGATRLLVMTTNDNINALGFYQRVGFRLAELRPGAVHEARRVKPFDPARSAHHEIPIRDELDLIRDLTAPSPESTRKLSSLIPTRGLVRCQGGDINVMSATQGTAVLLRVAEGPARGSACGRGRRLCLQHS